MRVLADNNLAGQIDKFEQTYNTANEKVVDIVHVNGKLIECKSWAIGSAAFMFFKTGRSSQSGSFSQFTSYLQNGISTMNDFEYWFDAKKESDEIKLKGEFQNMMYDGTNLTPQGSDVFDAIWANTTLRGNLFKLSATATKTPQEQFKELVSNTSSIFYQFVKVK